MIVVEPEECKCGRQDLSHQAIMYSLLTYGRARTSSQERAQRTRYNFERCQSPDLFNCTGSSEKRKELNTESGFLFYFVLFLP